MLIDINAFPSCLLLGTILFIVLVGIKFYQNHQLDLKRGLIFITLALAVTIVFWSYDDDLTLGDGKASSPDIIVKDDEDSDTKAKDNQQTPEKQQASKKQQIIKNKQPKRKQLN